MQKMQSKSQHLLGNICISKHFPLNFFTHQIVYQELRFDIETNVQSIYSRNTKKQKFP